MTELQFKPLSDSGYDRLAVDASIISDKWEEWQKSEYFIKKAGSDLTDPARILILNQFYLLVSWPS